MCISIDEGTRLFEGGGVNMKLLPVLGVIKLLVI